MPAARELAIPIPHEQIAEFCRKWGIRKLSFFGSVVRDDFTADSDVDVLVEFREGEGPRGWDIVHTQSELAEILGRKVDLVETHLLNRWIRRDVLAEAVEEYVEAGDVLYLGMMLDAARRATKRFIGVTRSDFEMNEDLQIILAHHIRMIGEAALKVPDDVRSKHPDIPWRKSLACGIGSYTNTST